MKFKTPNALSETPKPDDPVFRNSHFEIVLGMHDLFHHAHIASESAGFLTICDNTTDDWPIPRATDFLLTDLARLAKEHPGQPVAIIADGEVSSPVRGNGVGGRNSAFVLDCVNKIAGQRIAVLSAGTDGIDGTSPAAGAVADGETIARASTLKMDPQEFAQRSDSFNFFNALDDAIITGPTGNNLRDLRIFLRPNADLLFDPSRHRCVYSYTPTISSHGIVGGVPPLYFAICCNYRTYSDLACNCCKCGTYVASRKTGTVEVPRNKGLPKTGNFS